MQAVHALVPAAGEGRRFAASEPESASGKLFVMVAGRPMLQWTLEGLITGAAVSSLTVALSPARLGEYAAGSAASPASRDSRPRPLFVEGGEERQESVARCLAACPAGADDLVLVHDGGRPCLAAEDLENVIDAARRYGAAVLGRLVADTLKRVRDGFIEETVDRAGLFLAETPQVARRRDLERALARAREEARRATDEAGLLEAVGVGVRAVEARFANPKLTVPADLELIEQILVRRTGLGRRTG
ncbi:MAG TPA: 2-C-methyl-D-erythritol 4-phosphate cytidylyltransferase [Thermoanaerobaculia bacterium]|nr:2-C-methyl-D-erythritol 4-phosphate cytidylyltransferase [Thermoanaerobaculia bacterium]